MRKIDNCQSWNFSWIIVAFVLDRDCTSLHAWRRVIIATHAFWHIRRGYKFCAWRLQSADASLLDFCWCIGGAGLLLKSCYWMTLRQIIGSHSSGMVVCVDNQILIVYFAPCLMQTPPLTKKLVHPSCLHFLWATSAPCLMQTPPLTEKLVHPSWLHLLRFAPCW